MKPHAVLAQARAELLLMLRRGENVVVTLVIPLGVLLFFGKVDTITNLHDPVAFLVPGTLALAVMAAAMVSLGIATGFERRYGVLKRLGTTPLSRGGLLTAKTATILALEVLQAVLILALGVALGWSVTEGVIAAIGLLLIGTVAFAGLGLLMAGTLRAEATLGLANGLFLVFLFLGGMAYPLDRLPSGLEVLAKALPAAALSETLRSVLEPARSFATGEFVVLVVWAIAAPIAAARCFRWEE
jgi:ABC-2 type transport system permease protein